MAWNTPRPYPDPEEIITAKMLQDRAYQRHGAITSTVAVPTSKVQELAEKLAALCREYECELSGDGCFGLFVWFGEQERTLASLEYDKRTRSYRVMSIT